MSQLMETKEEKWAWRTQDISFVRDEIIFLLHTVCMLSHKFSLTNCSNRESYFSCFVTYIQSSIIQSRWLLNEHRQYTSTTNTPQAILQLAALREDSEMVPEIVYSIIIKMPNDENTVGVKQHSA